MSQDQDEILKREQRLYWDNVAATFDDEPDHGLRDPNVRHVWTKLLRIWLPPTQSAILDVGCGTGSLSMVLAELGHIISGIDISPRIITLAREKARASGYPIHFYAMDAATPQFVPQSFDVILCRHLLWTFKNPSQVLQQWVSLLKSKGRLILIEGYWDIGGGLHAADLRSMLPPSVTLVTMQSLSDQPAYWGKQVTDERYILIADRHE